MSSKINHSNELNLHIHTVETGHFTGRGGVNVIWRHFNKVIELFVEI